MAKTRHIKTRMNQRAIDNNIIKLALVFGAVQIKGSIEKYFLTKKNVDKTLQRLDRIRCRLIHAKDKGGIVLVTRSEGIEITAYRTPMKIKKFHNKSHQPIIMGAQ